MSQILNTDWEDLQTGDTVVHKDGTEYICSSNWGKSFRIKGSQTTIPHEDCLGFVSKDQVMNNGFTHNDYIEYD